MIEKVLFVPYKIEEGKLLYLVGKRAGTDVWQFPTGHVADNIKGEKIVEAAKRELKEEIGVSSWRNFINTKESFIWKSDYQSRGSSKVKEHIFAVDITGEKIKIEKAEFSDYKFLNFKEAKNILSYENHKKIAKKIEKMLKNSQYAKIFIICGPGGSGKEAVLEKLVNETGLIRAKTVTTRPRRPNESDFGRKFLSKEDFRKLSENNKLIEKNFFLDNWYGSIKNDVESETDNGRSVLIEVDLNGVKSFKDKYANVIAIFLTIDIKKLVRRMERRGGEDARRIKERLRVTRAELKESSICDYRIENKEGKLDETVKKIISIIGKEKGV